MSYDFDGPAPTGPQLPTCSIWSESPRANKWRAVFERVAGIPIQSYETVISGVPGHHFTDCYMLDMARVSLGEKTRLIAFLADEFGMTPDQVHYELQEGCPILAIDVIAAAPLPLLWDEVPR